MKSQSIFGYFEHVKDKTYIDRYPTSIIKLDDLKDSVIIEFGAGVGNDARFLIEYVKLKSNNLFLIESDIFYFVDIVDNLEKFFEEGLEIHFFPGNILANYYPNEFADFIYANNFLHCLGYRTLEEIKPFKPRDKVRNVFREAYRLLKEDGVFFGRTLSDYLDVDCLDLLENKTGRSEKEEFLIKTAKALQTGELTGISPFKLEGYAKEAGFRVAYTEIKPRFREPIEDFYFRFEK